MPGDPTQTIFHWLTLGPPVLALGPPGLALGLPVLALGPPGLALACWISTCRNDRVVSLNQRDGPVQVVLRCSGI